MDQLYAIELDFAGDWTRSAQSGDAAAVLAHTKLADPAHEATIRSVVEINGISTSLEKACKEKFGKSLSTAIGTGAAGPESAADYTVTAEGDAASVSHSSLPMPLKLVRDAGAWKLDSASIAGGPMAAMVPMAERLKTVMQSLTTDVNEGKITKIEDVATELQKRLMSGGG